MKALTCEMCGSTDLLKKDGVFVCQYCGCKYSVEEAKKMMIEGKVDVSGSTIKVDTSKELSNLYELARRAKDNDDCENAQKYYEQIVIKDPSSWEANFYTVYFQAANCTIREIGASSIKVSNSAKTVFNLIKENVTDPDEQRKVVNEVAIRMVAISSLMFDSYKKYYEGIGSDIQYEFTQAYANNCSAARDIAYSAGNYIVEVFGDTYGDIAAVCWMLGVKQHNILNHVFDNKSTNAQIIDSYNEKIKKYDPSYQAPETYTGGCYVATAVYGSYDCPQVWTLRRYRDYTLSKTWYGRTFVHIYYKVSPTIVKWFGDTKWFKKMWKGKLDKMVSNLNAKGVKNTPYIDKRW